MLRCLELVLGLCLVLVLHLEVPGSMAGAASSLLHDRFILEGREDDYLLLEAGGGDGDVDVDDVEEEEEDEEEDGEQPDIVLHSPWAPHWTSESGVRCPPRVSAGHGDCGAARCRSDSDCGGRESDAVCCHNGCVRTCMQPTPPPIEIDWVDRHTSIYDPAPSELTQRMQGSPQHASGAPQMVTMAGGCVLTLGEFKEVAGFSRTAHITRCFCEEGGVFCEVSRRVPAGN